MITLGALTLGAGLAYAEVRRFALIAANNEGDPDTNALVFAETDAKKVQRTLTELGGYGPGDVWMSLGRDRATLLTVFGELRRAISDARRSRQSLPARRYGARRARWNTSHRAASPRPCRRSPNRRDSGARSGNRP